MAVPVYDTSRWPVFQARMPAEPMLEHEFAEHVERLTRLFATEKRIALLIDARGAHPLNALQRSALAAVYREAYERDSNGIVAVAVVLSTAIERGIMTAIRWASRSDFEAHAFATPEAALAWLQERLAETAR